MVQVEVSKKRETLWSSRCKATWMSVPAPTSELSLRSSSGRGKPVYVIDLTNVPYSKRNV